MTVIAWDGLMFAADGLGVVSYGGRSFAPSIKIQQHEGVVFGTTGRMGPMQNAWIKWWIAGADPANVPPHGGAADDAGNFLVFKDGRCFMYSVVIPYAAEEKAPYAWGSGGDYALGAMLAGADARKAVKIAVNCDVNCGGPIVSIDLKKPQNTGFADTYNALMAGVPAA